MEKEDWVCGGCKTQFMWAISDEDEDNNEIIRAGKKGEETELFYSDDGIEWYPINMDGAKDCWQETGCKACEKKLRDLIKEKKVVE